MLNRKRNKNFNPARVVDGVPRALSQGAEEATSKLTEAAEHAGALVAKSAGKVGDRAGELSGQLGDRVGQAQNELKGSQRKLGRRLSGSAKQAKAKLSPSSDAILKAQLVKTSRELSRESSDLGQAVDSLNSIIKANRKASAKGRTRLIGGLALGAGLMYHFDAEHGRERRAATGRRVSGMVRGRGN